MERVGYSFAACIGNGERVAPCVIDIPCDKAALRIENLIHVAGKGAANNVVRRNACRVFILNTTQRPERIISNTARPRRSSVFRPTAARSHTDTALSRRPPFFQGADRPRHIITLALRNQIRFYCFTDDMNLVPCLSAAACKCKQQNCCQCNDYVSHFCISHY